MNFIPLYKLYYQAKNDYKTEYTKRYNSAFTKHFDINLREYNHSEENPAFFCYTEGLFKLNELIYKKYEELLYAVHSVPPILLRQFSLLCIIDEVKSTNAIEGVRSTRKEIIDILNERNTPHNARFKNIVKRYESLLHNETIPFATNEDIRKFYDNFAHDDIAAEDSANRLDGELFRKGAVDITSATGKTIHRGVYPEEKISQYMTASLDILNNENMPVLIRVAIFHYLFAYIHPFYDGNGRTSRFITSYYISKHFHRIVSLRLSVIIKKNQKKYYSLFHNTDIAINKGDLTPFVYGFLEIIWSTMTDIITVLKRKMQQLNKYAQKLRDLQPANADDLTQTIYYILLQSALFYGQGISISDLVRETWKSRATIQKRLDNMPPEHLLIQKNKTIYYKLNIAILKQN